MRKALIALVTLAAVASAACRQYDVDVYRNVNGKVLEGENHGVSQSFVCTADSILWAEFFVGAANVSGGHYEFDIEDGPNGSVIYEGASDTCNPNMHYKFVRANLARQTNDPLVKGKEYVLKVWLSSQNHPNDSLNWYADSTDPYKYGLFLDAPTGGQSQPLLWDLCARIEGVNRAVARDLFGINGQVEVAPDSTLHKALLDSMVDAGVSWDREWFFMEAIEGHEDTMVTPPRGIFCWYYWDSFMLKAHNAGVNIFACLSAPANWASSDTLLDTNSDHGVLNNYPPRNLYAQVESAGGINPNNYWASFVYEAVKRYMLNGEFWDSLGIHDYGITEWEVINEPNYWRTTWRGYDSLMTPGEENIPVMERLYAKMCDVTIQAARIAAGPDSLKLHIFPGALGGTFLYQPDTLTRGRDWLAGYYQYRANHGNAGISCHPYQYGDTAYAFRAGILARDLDTIRAIMQANGEGDKPLRVTEISWGPDTSAQHLVQTALSVPGAYVLSLAGSPTSFCDRVNWYTLWEKRSGGASLFQYDSAGRHFDRKPAYYAYRQMTQELLGKRMNGRVLSGNPTTDSVSRVYELEDTASGKRTWVGWRNYEPGAGWVPLKLAVRTDTINIAPLQRTPSDEPPPSPNYSVGADGWLTMPLDTIPVYISESTGPKRPDVLIDSVWTVTSMPREGEPLYFRARVTNIGNASTPEDSGASVSFYVNDSLIRTVSRSGPIAVHETLVFKTTQGWFATDTGHCLLKAVVNPTRSFVDTNWDNDVKYKLISVRPPLRAVQDGVNGPRTMIRLSGSGMIHAVAEFTQVGQSFVAHRVNPESDTTGWDSLTVGKRPAIGLGPDGLPWITFTRGDTVLCNELNPASVWRTRVIFAPALGQHVGPAALTVFQSRGQWKGPSAALGQVVFPVYQNGSPGSFVLHARFDSLNVTFDTLDKVLVPTVFRGHITGLVVKTASSTMKCNTLDSDRKGAILSGYGQELWTPGATGAWSDNVYVPLGQEHLANCPRTGPQ